MDGNRARQAIARLEAASRRIEAAAARAMAAPSVEGDPELQRKYDALRGEAGAALAELDRLLGAIEP
jgi:hypothetical protein